MITLATGAEGVKTLEEAEKFGGSAGEWFDKCYHQLCDDVKNCNMTAWEVNTKLVAHSVATFALSLEGFPTRTLDEISAQSAEAYGKIVKYHGHRLTI